MKPPAGGSFFLLGKGFIPNVNGKNRTGAGGVEKGGIVFKPEIFSEPDDRGVHVIFLIHGSLFEKALVASVSGELEPGDSR